MRLTSRLTALAAMVVTGLGVAVTTTATATASPSKQTTVRSTTTTGGSMLWIEKYPGHATQGEGAEGTAVVASPDGSAVFVTGSTDKAGVGLGVTEAYNATTGAGIWRSTFRDRGRNAFYAIATSPDGSKVFVTGGQTGGLNGSNYATVAYNAATGVQLWADKAGPGGPARTVAVSPDGSIVYVSGSAGLAAYNASTGAPLWGDAGGTSLALSPDGSTLYVTGDGTITTGGTSYYTYLTRAYNAVSGTALWTAQYKIPRGNCNVYSLKVSPDGSTVFITGYAAEASGTTTYRTVAYDAATGAQLWVRSFLNGKGPSWALSLAVSPDSSKVFVTGGTNIASGGGYGTVAYNATTGAALWVARYGTNPNGATGADIAVSPDGSQVFVTGASGGKAASVSAYGTVAYNADTGVQSWAARYGPGPGDGALSVAVSPDGSKVFVTGGTNGGGQETTVAYGS